MERGIDPVTGQGLTGCKEADKARCGPVVLFGSVQGPGLSLEDVWDNQDWGRQFM